jgi:hypothetical protein
MKYAAQYLQVALTLEIAPTAAACTGQQGILPAAADKVHPGYPAVRGLIEDWGPQILLSIDPAGLRRTIIGRN